jgi:hypothetical protein
MNERSHPLSQGYNILLLIDGKQFPIAPEVLSS